MKSLLICLLVFGIVISLESPLLAQNPEKLFQLGMMKEEAEGNLDEAIDIYYKLVNDGSVNRTIRAKALMQVGNCYEKLGKKNAQYAYEKLIAEYSDQPEIVAMARQKLNLIKKLVSNTAESGLIARHLKTESNDRNFIKTISPDGRYYAYEDMQNFEIMVCELETGKIDSITKGNTWFPEKEGKEFASNPSNPIWSPDGNKIAYTWYAQDTKELRITDLNTKTTQTILKGKSDKDIPSLTTFTNDGKTILGILEVEGENKNIQKLVKISLTDKNFKTFENFEEKFGHSFSYSPDGKYLLYARPQENSINNDIYILSVADHLQKQITYNKANDSNPVWNADGTFVIFASSRTGTNDLYKIGIKNGNPEGNVDMVKRNLGKYINIMGVDKSNAVYYAADNSRYDIYTLDLKEKIENGITKVNRITDLALRSGGKAPRFSKDGRYISYLNETSNLYDLKEEIVDNKLGAKYFIGIYDTKTGEHRELKLDFYKNQGYYDINEYIPDWSYDGTKLLMHGRIKDNYQGGFFTVNVNTQKITPVLTSPNSTYSSPIRAGRFPVFSKDKNKIYYTSNNWKNLMEYNMLTKENKLVLADDRGYFFKGLMDDGERCVLFNSNGIFSYNLVTEKLNKVAESDWLFGWSKDEKYYYTVSKPENMNIHDITRISFDGNEPKNIISLDEIFPNGKIWNVTFHPTKEIMVFDMKTNNGNEIFKLSGVFD